MCRRHRDVTDVRVSSKVVCLDNISMPVYGRSNRNYLDFPGKVLVGSIHYAPKDRILCGFMTISSISSFWPEMISVGMCRKIASPGGCFIHFISL